MPSAPPTSASQRLNPAAKPSTIARASADGPRGRSSGVSSRRSATRPSASNHPLTASLTTFAWLGPNHRERSPSVVTAFSAMMQTLSRAAAQPWP